ncbi:MAG TPA: zf-HC2 domain-containing protein [Vicinamibacterales bacterium]|nr:zf-HC2 domain-containing protein [Vicinamibacterales bacterium]
MHNCDALDSLVTPFIDGELPDPDRRAVEEHLRACPPCHSRVSAERAVHDLLRARRDTLCRTEAPDALHLRCAALVHESIAPRTGKATAENAASHFSRNQNLEPGTKTLRTENPRTENPRTPNPELRTPNPVFFPRRFAPLAMAASLVIVVGGAFVYQATDKSARVMAAELVADHAKCFALNSALGTFQSASVVEQNMGAAFNWNFHLPKEPVREGLELVGARLCMYGKGKIAHIMYRHQGSPVSVFMLPKTMRTQEFVEVLGHEAAIWCADNRTFVVVAGEPRPNVEQIAAFMQASLH